MEQDLLAIKRKQWRKMPDTPLGRVIQDNRARDLKWRFCQESIRNPDLLEGLQTFLLAQSVQGGQLSATMKCAREMVFDVSSSEGKRDSGSAFWIAEFLRHRRPR